MSPTGRHLLTVPIGQWSLTLHDAEDGTVENKLDAAGVVPTHPMNTDGGRGYWDDEAAFVADGTIVVGTSESDARYGSIRHWIVDVGDDMTLHGEVGYPFPVSGTARSAGDGIWYTVSPDRSVVHLWQLAADEVTSPRSCATPG